MNSKLFLSLSVLLSASVLSACSQQSVIPPANASVIDETTNVTTITDATDGMDGYGNVGGGSVHSNDGANSGRGRNNGGGVNTDGFDAGNGADYDAYGAERQRQQQLAAQRARQQQLAAERARQQQLAAQQRARQQGQYGAGGNGQYGAGGNGQYGAGGNGQYGAGGSGQYGAGGSGQYGAGGSGQYNGSNYSGGGKYSASDLRNSASLLSKRIVYFDFDQSSIKPEYIPILDAHANYLSANPSATVRLEGHADDRGSREYNLALSERRSRTVRDYLAVKGVRQGQMSTIGYGEEMPAKLGESESSWSQNRRVEIKYSGE